MKNSWLLSIKKNAGVFKKIITFAPYLVVATITFAIICMIVIHTLNEIFL